MGILEPDRGRIDYGDLTMRDITMTSQRPYLLHDTVYENIVYPLKIRRIKPDKRAVLEMLEAKINRAEAEKCFWEPRRLNRIKESYLKLKNSAYENKKVSGEAAEK